MTEQEFAEERAYMARQQGIAMSWRDVGHMIHESETRLRADITTGFLTVNLVLKDHEDRLSVEEDFTVGVKASGNTADRFFAFGKWLIATAIAVCALVITIIIFGHWGPA